MMEVKSPLRNHAHNVADDWAVLYIWSM